MSGTSHRKSLVVVCSALLLFAVGFRAMPQAREEAPASWWSSLVELFSVRPNAVARPTQQQTPAPAAKPGTPKSRCIIIIGGHSESVPCD